MNDAGRIGFVVRGEYDSSATYDFLDVVLFGNSSYVAKKLTIGNAPAENSEYWQMLARASDGGASAAKLTNARTIQTNLESTDAASFDGSEDVTPGITGILPIANGGTGNSTGKVASATNADSATKAIQDGKGNNIAETYAKKDIYTNGTENGGISVGAGLMTSRYFSDVGTITCDFLHGNPEFHVAGMPTEYQGEYFYYVDINVEKKNFNIDTSVTDLFNYECNNMIFSGYNPSCRDPYDELDYILMYYNSSYITLRFMASADKDSNYLYDVFYNRTVTIILQRYGDNLYQALFGTYNATRDGNKSVLPILAVGNGTKKGYPSNAFRITYEGAVYATKQYNSSGADYAEFIKPWADGNPDNEDRVGYFVAIKEGLLHKANEGDYIAGITSGNPSVVGNSDEDYYWRYERDEFNRIVMEDEPDIPNARMKLAEDYDPSLQGSYVERKDRKEWDYVGMVGVLPVRDDGTCIAGQYCRCGQDGIATLATERDFDTFYVIERINDHVVSVILK